METQHLIQKQLGRIALIIIFTQTSKRTSEIGRFLSRDERGFSVKKGTRSGSLYRADIFLGG